MVKTFRYGKYFQLSSKTIAIKAAYNRKDLLYGVQFTLDTCRRKKLNYSCHGWLTFREKDLFLEADAVPSGSIGSMLDLEIILGSRSRRSFHRSRHDYQKTGDSMFVDGLQEEVGRRLVVTVSVA
ncbi:hypothetical protein CEXT_346471 [Caerostris extrusa]|uniref:Uncharacterized protein n=1 Tax=Caerostris extrusa TaxID=172846 RepID=A0AAV4R5T5_CAEEX|nr:hypothetical protein CEXT_346471 [Caerostris extrusa]